ncbi:Isotrichodermin C-15 hydroxylase 10 [Colletotrichum chlorophyti]|uniref:Isotrichodermin C-15 hydroxylase 10 n=1 Tax=Colletotrichum chlorophyti TaxID=708187 RepID=A0A1Q8RG76_9PEZI|nr:Isotrichodermin C-15 hydroxylase 10 [Colletotrichum chlorophyti]
MIIPSNLSSFSNVRLVVALPILLICLVCLGSSSGEIKSLTKHQVIIRFVSSAIYNVYFHPLRHFPGPKLNAISRLPFSRMICGGKAYKRITELHAKYGPVVRVSPDTIDFADPRAFKDLMGHSKGGGGGGGENYKDPINAKFKPHSIINAGREDHARIRRVLAHGFSAQSMVEQQPLIQQQIDLLIQRLHENCEDGRKDLNMVAWYNWTTFDIIGDLALGEPFGCLQNSEYHPWVSAIFANIHANMYRNQFLRFPLTRPFAEYLIPKSLKAQQLLHHESSKEKVHRRMALGESRPDFVQSMMLKEGALAMTKPEIEETADTLIIAGSETTASVLSGATYFLTTNPEAMAKLAEEVRISFSSEQEIDVLSVQKLRYMLAVLDESMRVYPVVPIGLTRMVKPGGDYICERYVPAGTRVMVSQWPIYHNEKYFSQSESFIPERWLGDPRFENDDRGALQPFSFGPRNCIGRNLAMSEMRVILARVIWNFDMQIADDSKDWTEQELFGLWKKGPLHVRLTPRKKD